MAEEKGGIFCGLCFIACEFASHAWLLMELHIFFVFSDHLGFAWIILSGQLVLPLAACGTEATEELRLVRRDILKCFENVSCYLFPYPGQAVAERKEFKGNLSAMRDSFREELERFVPSVLASSKLVPKKFLGQQVTCGSLYNYILVRFHAFCYLSFS